MFQITLHIYIDYNCKDCGERFIPISTWKTCPNCGKEADITFPLAEKIYHSGVYNKNTHYGSGSHMPGAWAVLSLGDRMALWGFNLFDWLDSNPDGTLDIYLMGMELPEGLRGEYIRAVIQVFFDEYQKNH